MRDGGGADEADVGITKVVYVDSVKGLHDVLFQSAVDMLNFVEHLECRLVLAYQFVANGCCCVRRNMGQ